MDNNDFIKKIVIPDPEISECREHQNREHQVKSKIENICQWKKYSNNFQLRFMKLILIFLSIGCKFIRINTSKEGYNTDYKASRI